MEELLEKKQATIKELLEAVFSMRSAPRLYKGDRNGARVSQSERLPEPSERKIRS
jgi:hypothetical protein